MLNDSQDQKDSFFQIVNYNGAQQKDLRYIIHKYIIKINLIIFNTITKKKIHKTLWEHIRNLIKLVGFYECFMSVTR